MPGKIILAGGNEMRPGCEEMDEQVLREARGTGGVAARVVFLPTAVARHDPQGSGRGAAAYWGRLGASCAVAMILNRADADRQEWVEMIEGATLVYLGGGDPDVLLDALAGSAAWQAILRVYARGGVVGGSSAGAMVVCAQTLLPGKRDGASTPWVDGLGLVSAALTLPHYSAGRAGTARDLAARLVREVSPDSAVLGIPEMSGLLGDGAGWDVVGPGLSTVFRDGDMRIYRRGERIAPPAPGA